MTTRPFAILKLVHNAIYRGTLVQEILAAEKALGLYKAEEAESLMLQDFLGHAYDILGGKVDVDHFKERNYNR